MYSDGDGGGGDRRGQRERGVQYIAVEYNYDKNRILLSYKRLGA